MGTDLPGITYRACRVALRLPGVRWLLAELIPFGFLAAGLAVTLAGNPLHLVGSLLATFANWAVCIVYFYRVLGAAAGWVTALFPLIVALTFEGNGVAEASSRWAVTACLALTLAVVAGAAVRNGERWARCGRGRPPGRTLQAYSWSRGALTGLWLA